MLISKTLLAVVVSSTQVLARRDHPECIETCINDNAGTSLCDGDETGEQLDTCKCESLMTAPTIPCIRECPEADQREWVTTVPALCRESLFPGVAPSEAPSGDDTSGNAEAPEGAGDSEDTSDDGQAKEDEPSKDAANGLTAPRLVAAGGVLVSLLL